MIKTFKEGNYISIAVLLYNRGLTDPKRIFEKIFSMDEEKPDLYEIITPCSILNRLYPIKELLPLPNSIPLEILTKRIKKITLAYAACQKSTSSSILMVCSCKKGCKTTKCQCKKHKQ